jgi:hypothetical protein
VTSSEVCKDKVAGDTCNIGSASFTVGTVYKMGSAKEVNFTAGAGGSWDKVYTKTGLKIQLPVDVSTAASPAQTAKGAINLTAGVASVGHSPDSFYLFMTEENKDDNVAKGVEFNATIDSDSDGDLEVKDTTVNNGNEYDIPGTSDDTTSMVTSDLATTVKRTVSADRGTAVVEYHGGESYADIFLTAVGATVTSGDSSSGATGSVVKLGSVSVSDAEAATVASKNLIVVGGSCINTVAADLLGGALCGADFEAKTGVGAGSFLIQTFERTGGKVATLVAGYNAEDTSNAAKYLTTQVVDTTVGKKYKGTSATTASLVTEQSTTPAAEETPAA